MDSGGPTDSPPARQQREQEHGEIGEALSATGGSRHTPEQPNGLVLRADPAHECRGIPRAAKRRAGRPVSLLVTVEDGEARPRRPPGVPGASLDRRLGASGGRGGSYPRVGDPHPAPPPDSPTPRRGVVGGRETGIADPPRVGVFHRVWRTPPRPCLRYPPPAWGWGGAGGRQGAGTDPVVRCS